MTLSISKAELIGTFVESIAYGLCLALFKDCFVVLRRRGQKQGKQYYLHVTAVALFVLVTTHMIIDIIRAMAAFTGEPSNPLAPILFYSKLGGLTSVCKTSVYSIATLVSDAFIVYRCFIVWGRSLLVIVVPGALFIAGIGTGIATLHSLNTLESNQSFGAANLSQGFLTCLALTLSLNVICTGLIAFKVWSIQRQVASIVVKRDVGSGTSLSRAIAIMVESCAAYSAVLFIVIGTYASGSTVMFIFLDILSPIIGIVFASAIVRVGRGESHGDHSSGTASTLQFNSHHPTETQRTTFSNADDVGFHRPVKAALTDASSGISDEGRWIGQREVV